MKEINKVKNYWYTEANKLQHSTILGEEDVYQHLKTLSKGKKRILEVGIGNGRMTKLLRESNKEAEYFGVDINMNIKKSDTICSIGDARLLPFRDQTFDLVFSLGVIEHFPETNIAVLEHARVLKNGGYVVVSTPHLSLLTPLRLLAYHIKDRKKGSFEETKGRNISLSAMQKFFSEANLRVVDKNVYGLWTLGYLFKKFRYYQLLEKIQHLRCVGAYLYLVAKK